MFLQLQHVPEPEPATEVIISTDTSKKKRQGWRQVINASLDDVYQAESQPAPDLPALTASPGASGTGQPDLIDPAYVLEDTEFDEDGALPDVKKPGQSRCNLCEIIMGAGRLAFPALRGHCNLCEIDIIKKMQREGNHNVASARAERLVQAQNQRRQLLPPGQVRKQAPGQRPIRRPKQKRAS